MALTRCLSCGNLTRGGSYCRRCRLGNDWNHRKRAATMRTTMPPVCHLCGNPGSWTDPTDPLTADHTIPRGHGGRHSALLPAHRSCNSRRGTQFLA